MISYVASLQRGGINNSTLNFPAKSSDSDFQTNECPARLRTSHKGCLSMYRAKLHEVDRRNYIFDVPTRKDDA